jgi:hypothetical protein
MAQNERIWDESGLKGTEREERRQELAERYRKHIEARELCYAYSAYPYIEWYSDNGRVVLELAPSQVEIFDIQGVFPRKEKTAKELVADRQKRTEAMAGFMSGMVKETETATSSER